MKDRKIQLEGGFNVRDIGGYVTEDGHTIRWSRMLRGDNTNALSQPDVELILNYGLTSEIDLRGHAEIDAAPSVFKADRRVQYRNIDLFASELSRQWESGSMASYYIFCLERSGIQISAVLEAVSSAISEGCVLVHCAAGKDRTGIITALILRSLRVPIDVVAEDYALSWQYLQPLIELLKQRAFERGENPDDVSRGFGSARPETMIETLKYIESRYGGIDSYLKALEVPLNFTEDLANGLLQ